MSFPEVTFTFFIFCWDITSLILGSSIKWNSNGTFNFFLLQFYMNTFTLGGLLLYHWKNIPKWHSQVHKTLDQNIEHWTLKLLLCRLWSFLPSGLPWDWRDRGWGGHLHHEETLAFCFTLQNIFPSLGIKCDILIGLIWKYGKFSWWILHSPQQICKKWQIWPNLYRVLC